jgi:hypothetical protein
MRRTALLWTAATLITLASAVFQRRTGPTRPVRGTAEVGGAAVSYRLARSHGGTGDQPVRLTAPAGVNGTVAWRRFPTGDPWQLVPMTRSGSELEAALPHQPPAGKLEYQVRLVHGSAWALVPARPAVTRFKGEVPAALLVGHVAAMFTAMLLSTAAGLRALMPGGDARRLATAATVVLAVGGFVLGPLVQKAAFGALWTGVPFGWDLTDNKTLIAGIAWGAALIASRRSPVAPRWIAAAAAVTLVVFAIPHSVWGSQIDWQGTRPQALGG